MGGGFCVSTRSDVAGDISKAHSEKWIIHDDQVDSFGKYLVSLLWESLTISNLPDQLVNSTNIHELSRGLSIQAEVQPITYQDRTVEFAGEAEFQIQMLRDLKDQIALIKPEKLSNEKEVRFAFCLMYNDKKNPLMIKQRY
jgi:hypothetical protein